ncbi:MAG TPA: transposase [Acidobacteriaceae bacterium]
MAACHCWSGYEDLNDHEQLRCDPLLALLAGKGTLNRLELAGRTARYHKIGYSPRALDRLLTDLFLESHAAPPAQRMLDLDATDIPLYAISRSGSSTATTIATVICRCTSSPAISCCARGCGPHLFPER